MRSLMLFAFGLLLEQAASQQIWDKFETTWDRSKLFTYTNINPPINFAAKGTARDANILVADTSVQQSMIGFGASMTDSSAQLFNNLKSRNVDNYWSLIGYLFDPVDGRAAAGLNFIRVPLGASDFSATRYTFDDVAGDTSLSRFNIDNAPSYLFSTLKDVLSVNKIAKINLIPWSPPAWMKDSGTMNGGSLKTEHINTYANYLLKSVQGFTNKGIPVHSISLQNEPEFSTNTYPSCSMPVSTAAQLGNALRTLLNNNGFSGVKILGYDHNWVHAGAYPVQLMQQAGNSFAGVGFHCYEGSVGQQDSFKNAYPNKELYFTECSGTLGSDWWSDIKWHIDNLWIGSIEHGASVAAMWNFALDGSGEPKLPGAGSCEPVGCRGVVTINGDGTWAPNQEFYGLAQASKAVLPRDSGGPTGRRIGVSLSGTYGWALRVSAFVTGRTNSADWSRYSLVVLNWRDNDNGNWNPQPVTATIEFRGLQAVYTFPVGVTTLWWYAPASGAKVASANATMVEEVPLSIAIKGTAAATSGFVNATEVPASGIVSSIAFTTAV